MVFRLEGEFDRVAANRLADGPSDGWTGDVTLEVVEEGQKFKELKVRKSRTPRKVGPY